jgi:hypothetical protein
MYIYTLECPISNEIRYIGKTNDLLKRYRNHISLKSLARNGNKHLENWIKKILSKNKKPIIKILDKVPDNDWEIYEIYWIAQFKAWNFKLLNILEGGGTGHSGRHLSEEHKRKLSLATKGIPKGKRQYKISSEVYKK